MQTYESFKGEFDMWCVKCSEDDEQEDPLLPGEREYYDRYFEEADRSWKDQDDNQGEI